MPIPSAARNFHQGMRANPDELEERNEKALGLLAALKVRYQQTSDPASRFVALLKAALACGRAHLADRRGIVPQEAELWGWHRKPAGRGWAPLGTRIGWVAESDLFLEPRA